MMKSHRPEIFISAATADLGSCRQLIKEALLTLGCTPVEQTNFPPAASTVRQMLRDKIADCDAVIHVAGDVFGAEPLERNADEPRRSYTHIEVEIARELGKPVYTFICGQEFPFDEHEAEDQERQVLQQAHRQRLQESDDLFVPVNSRDELTLKVHQLQTRVEKIADELKRSRSWLGRGVLVGLILSGSLAGGLWFVSQKGSATQEKVKDQSERIAKFETELEKQRRYIKQVADVYTRQQAKLAELKLTDQQKFDRALEQVAANAGVPEKELRSAIGLFVAAIESDATADFYDQALAKFAQKKFAEAATSAGKAADQAHQEWLAAEGLVKAAQTRADDARGREREALSLLGQSSAAAGEYEKAVEAFRRGLKLTPRVQFPAFWMEFQVRLGNAAFFWASRSAGKAIHTRRALAIESFQAALQVLNQDSTPAQWAATQSDLALALRDHALASLGTERTSALNEAIKALRAAMGIYTHGDKSHDHARAQHNLAMILRDKALASNAFERARFLDEAVSACNTALETRTREELPKQWALTSNTLGLLFHDQATTSKGIRREELLEKAISVYNDILKVIPQGMFTFQRAITQKNLAYALTELALTSSSPDRTVRLGLAVSIYQKVLGVFSRQTYPRNWAHTHNNLAAAYYQQALTSSGKEQSQLLEKAIESWHLALEIFTRQSLPQEWARTINNLASTFSKQAEAANGAQKARLLEKAVSAYITILDVFTRDSFPLQWATIQSSLGFALKQQADVSQGVLRKRLLNESAAAYQNVLKIRTKKAMPSRWAATQNLLASVLRTMAMDASGIDRARLMAETENVYRASLEVYTFKAFQQDWADAQQNLGNCLFFRETYPRDRHEYACSNNLSNCCATRYWCVLPNPTQPTTQNKPS